MCILHPVPFPHELEHSYPSLPQEFYHQLIFDRSINYFTWNPKTNFWARRTLLKIMDWVQLFNLLYNNDGILFFLKENFAIKKYIPDCCSYSNTASVTHYILVSVFIKKFVSHLNKFNTFNSIICGIKMSRKFHLITLRLYG